MADYRIVCTRKENGHIVSIGTGTEPKKYGKTWTVAEVRTALRSGHQFHTVSTSTGKKAYVESFDTIRTKPDQVTDDNLGESAGSGCFGGWRLGAGFGPVSVAGAGVAVGIAV